MAGIENKVRDNKSNGELTNPPTYIYQPWDYYNNRQPEPVQETKREQKERREAETESYRRMRETGSW